MIQRSTTGWGSLVPALEGFLIQEPIDELNRQSHIDRDGEQLENDATQHDPPTLVGIRVIPGRDCREASADTLDAQCHNIGGEEHNGVCDSVQTLTFIL